MFLLFPIGHDELVLRRLPFATIGLMALLAIAFFATIGPITADEQRAVAAAEAAAARDTLRDDVVRVDETGEVIEPTGADAKAEAAPAQSAGPDRGAFVQRWGFVPDRPGKGLLTHMFLHAGAAELVLGLVFLWVAGVKLEELWSRPVYLAGFALFALVGALAYAATASDPSAPLLGATGGIAGLMGAMLVRLGKSKIYFAYFFWFFRKPRYGTFDAPAYTMPLFYLLAQLGVHFAYLMAGSLAGVGSFAQWIGGFAAGCGAAFALKRLRFEERVLRRVVEEPTAPEDLPLVAFQRRAEPAGAPGAAGAQLEPIGAVLVGVEKAALRFALPSGAPLVVATAEVGAWATGRIATVTPEEEALLGGTAPLRTPAVILAFVLRPGTDRAGTRVILVDAARLKYAALLDRPAATPRAAFFLLLARLDAALPAASFAGDRTRVKGGALPEHPSSRDLLAQLGIAARQLAP